jgi:protein O-GlcNAc transferase
MPQMSLTQTLALGMQHQQAGQMDEAERLYRSVLAIDAKNADALHLLGLVEQQRGRHQLAIPLLNDAIAARPTAAEFRYNLGNSLLRLGRIEEAVDTLEAAARVEPTLFEAQHSLGTALMLTGRSNRAVEAFQTALRMKSSAEAHNNLGLALKDQGDIETAIRHFARAVELRDNYHHAHSNRLYALHFRSSHDGQSIFAAHRAWGERHVDHIEAVARSEVRTSNANRRLRIGYVSPDLRDHPVGRSVLPLIEHADRDAFEIVCFSDSWSNDPIATQIRAGASNFHQTAHLSDERLAHFIALQKIDILVDLTLHMHRNRLLTFARKPAPIQVTFIGYPATTGLKQIDYRITDRRLDPLGETDAFNSERLIRLPRSFWCYVPDDAAPPVSELPSMRTKFITFGSLNNPCKMSDAVIDLWSEVLRAVPNSRIMLFVIERENVGERFRNFFAKHDIDPSRLDFVSRQSRLDYLNQYSQIDIALDPFPYNGHMTSCDALWMGVPIVSLRGHTSVGRGGESLLASLNLLEFLAHSPKDYVEIATALANDPVRLANLRRSMRDRMLASAICDASGFTRDVEAAYRSMLP